MTENKNNFLGKLKKISESKIRNFILQNAIQTVNIITSDKQIYFFCTAKVNVGLVELIWEILNSQNFLNKN